MNSQIFNIYLKIVIAHIMRRGLDLNDLLQRAGFAHYIDQPVDITQTCNFSDFLGLLHLLEEVSGDPLICAEAGSYIHPGDYGQVGLLLMNCETYGDAIAMSYRFQHLVNNVMQRQPYVLNRAVYSRLNDGHYNAEEIRPYVELEQATLVHMSHFITGHMFQQVPITLKFRHAPTVDQQRYQHIFKTTLRFNCDHTEIKMPSAVMQAQLRSSDKATYALMLKQLKEREQKLGVAPGLEDELRIFIPSQLYSGGPLLEKCASLANVSASTLKRHLALLGTSYQEIFDQIRFEHSRILLQKRQYSIAEVADSMGFSGSASFSRSFRKWSGMTPSAYRNQGLY